MGKESNEMDNKGLWRQLNLGVLCGIVWKPSTMEDS